MSGAKGTSLVIGRPLPHAQAEANEVAPRWPPRMASGWGQERPALRSESENCRPHQGEEGAGGTRCREPAGCSTPRCAGRRGHSDSAPPRPPEHLALCLSSLGLSPSCTLCNKPLIVKCFPDSESLQQIIKPEGGRGVSWKPPAHGQWVRSTGGSGLMPGV